MIQAKAFLQDPGNVPLTLEITMTLNEWRSLMLKVNENEWPAWAFGAAVSTAIRHATKHFDSSSEYSQ